MSDKKRRVQLDFSEAAWQRLEDLQVGMSLDKKGAVIQRALTLLDWWVRMQLEGREFFRKDPETGELYPIELIF